ncbi:unnamed protein product [Rotaria magnacalcarata]|nr:unnamed protein product [Rotaria magnacalcarata]
MCASTYPGGSSCRLKGHRKRPETAIKRHKTALIFTLFRRNPSARFTGRFISPGYVDQIALKVLTAATPNVTSNILIGVLAVVIETNNQWFAVGPSSIKYHEGILK